MSRSKNDDDVAEHETGRDGQLATYGIVGHSDVLQSKLFEIQQVGRTNATVLVRGESGTGKELVARAIHRASPRRAGPLVIVNCAAISAGLVESELFGHEKGAFTGATNRRIGRFELADNGTLFLDEIGELPLDTQVKLLRVLQEGEFERVGGNASVAVNVRIVAATNRDLETAVVEGTFRADLFFRLNVFPIVVPPLRERREDISDLIAHVIDKLATKLNRNFTGVSPSSMSRLMAYDWPGNVRELENVLERGAILSPGFVIEVPELRQALGRPTAEVGDQLSTLEEVERVHIERTLMKTRWMVAGHGGAADLLAVNPSTLRSRIKKLGIRRSNVTEAFDHTAPAAS